MSEREQSGPDPSEQGNYEGVSGGEYTAQSGDPDAEAAQQPAEGEEPDDE